MRELITVDADKSPGCVEFIEKVNKLSLEFNKSLVPLGPGVHAVVAGYTPLENIPEVINYDPTEKEALPPPAKAQKERRATKPKGELKGK